MDSAKYIGLDVHKQSISIAVLNAAGKIVMECVIETKAITVLQFLGGLRGELHVTFEEGTWAAWLYDLIQPHVTEVVVCDPRQNALLNTGNKSDRIDARKLAELYWWKRGGASPNPGGRPKKRPITAAYSRNLLKELPPEMLVDSKGNQLFPIGTTWLDLVAMATIRAAASGDYRAARELRESIEGKASMRVEAFRDMIVDEEVEDPLGRRLMELDPADRNLILAATRKVVNMTLKQAAIMKSEGIAPGTNAENSTGEGSGSDESSGQANL
jgi:Transposase/Family of unknown function (DUF5681)